MIGCIVLYKYISKFNLAPFSLFTVATKNLKNTFERIRDIIQRTGTQVLHTGGSGSIPRTAYSGSPLLPPTPALVNVCPKRLFEAGIVSILGPHWTRLHFDVWSWGLLLGNQEGPCSVNRT